jgi:uncharacterized protein (DUF885 family)
LQALDGNVLASEADRRAYLSLMRSIASRLEASTARLQKQASRGIRLPAPAAGPAFDFFAALGTRFARLPDEAVHRMDSVAPADAARFTADLRGVIGRRVKPSLTRLLAELKRLKTTGPATVGLMQYPHGRDAYRDLVRFHTSLETTPEAVMAYGEARIARINAAIAQIAKELGLDGREGVRRLLVADPRFVAHTPEDVEARYLAAIRRIEPKIPQYFSLLPKAPYGVRRLDPAAEATMTFGYYQPPTVASPIGEYRFNGSKLEDRSLLLAAPLIYHELIPGHHFQMALQVENERLPPFRRLGGDVGFNAYVEGWAEYAATLAEEMGMFPDPYDRLARLSADAFLSARLVVDPGLNYFGWSLERARTYMHDNTFQSATEITTETLRYSTAIPGQGLGYKIGERTMLELRESMRKAEGDAFDIREFHAEVLGHGAMPLSVLQAYFARRHPNPPPALQ